MTTQPEWFALKACHPEDMDLFWPTGSGSASAGPDYVKALAICARCPVVAECRADAERYGDIVDGYTTHGQVVGGCGPYKPAKGERVPVMLPCSLDGCAGWFAKRVGANMYCSAECAVEARRAGKARHYRERKAAS